MAGGGDNSDILFNDCRLDVMIWYFSVKHRLHVLLPFLYGLARSITSHDSIGVMLFAFRLQIYFESSVEFAFSWFLKVLLCWYHQSFKEFSVRPMEYTPSSDSDVFTLYE